MNIRVLVFGMIALSLCSAAMAEKRDVEISVRNVNCKSFFSDTIDVHIFDSHHSSCSNKWVKGIGVKETKTVKIKAGGCRYSHEAGGTVLGSRDLDPDTGMGVLCYQASSDLACQCEATIF
ncbi:MAG: hypothetical protein VYC38_08465 [Pseudomonadota bacterium]|nr:hypothetical protein [Pseudomonadota bacterium]